MNRGQVRDGPKAVEWRREGVRTRAASADMGSRCGSGQ